LGCRLGNYCLVRVADSMAVQGCLARETTGDCMYRAVTNY
jgi:hypothetical protein